MLGCKRCWLSDIFCVLQSSVLDFGKIIIYTSNLRIIRTPLRKPEALRHRTMSPVDLEGCPKARERGSRRRTKAKDGEEKQSGDTETKVMILGEIIPTTSPPPSPLSLCFSAYVFSPSFFTLRSLSRE